MRTFIIIGIILLFVCLGGYMVYSSMSTTHPEEVPLPTPMQLPQPTSTPTPLTWTDPSEFSFQYDASLQVNKHEEDKVNYAHVELRHPSHPGSIILWTKDTTATSIEDWEKKTKQTGAIDTTLGNIPGKKTFGEKENSIIISAIRNGYLYQIDAMMEDRAFWEHHLNIILSSYTFLESADPQQSKQSAPAPDTSSAGSGGIEEETIE